MTCALCSLPLTPPAVRSQVLEGDFHEACYQAAWKERMPRVEPRGGLPIQDDINYVDMEGPNETVVG
jgi:hypothetical protein